MYGGWKDLVEKKGREFCFIILVCAAVASSINLKIFHDFFERKMLPSTEMIQGFFVNFRIYSSS